MLKYPMQIWGFSSLHKGQLQSSDLERNIQTPGGCMPACSDLPVLLKFDSSEIEN